MVGQAISHYKVLEKIGEGGMGEVFLAEDTSLDRKVALKFLPDFLQQDPMAEKRFLREAKSAAALDHPYICHIHEVGEEDGRSFISMEYVQGETLKDKLAKGPLPLKEALEKATEIAEALEAAHKQNIVHRDLKPSNIMLTPDGHVKVMDFGLAKQLIPAEGVGSQEETLSASLTKAGTTLGTLAYMSPEQLRGEKVDTRSDIFSFGIVLYEMLTGIDPFKQDQPLNTASSILKDDPPSLSQYMDDAPPLLQYTVKKMLAKELDSRYQSAHEVRTDLGGLISEIAELSTTQAGIDSFAATTREMGAPVAARPWRLVLPWGIAALMVLIAAFSFWSLWQTASSETSPVRRFTTTLPSTEGPPRFRIALTPDGRHLIYPGRRDNQRQLYLRAMDQLEAAPIRGTEGASAPFVSPDGQWVGFYSQQQLKRVSLEGGPVFTICDLRGYPKGASWGPDGNIIFALTSGLLRVSGAGGTPQSITTPDTEKGELGHRWPQVLPGGQAVLFTVWTGDPVESRIGVLSLETGEWITVAEGSSYARYSPTGHLLYARSRTLIAAPFDLSRLEVTGNPAPVLEGVETYLDGHLFFNFSRDGTLLYLPVQPTFRRDNLLWVDRQGQSEPLLETDGGLEQPRLSPDGQRLVVLVEKDQSRDLWIYEIASQRFTPLTFGGVNTRPIWTPDGRRIAFTSDRSGPWNLFWMPADGSGEAEQLTTSEGRQDATSWSPDGRFLAFQESQPESRDIGRDIWVLPFEGERKPQPFLRTQFHERHPMFSPDGRWIAFTSDRSGQDQIYVKAYPGPGGIEAISTDGGAQPMWAPSGKELYYRNGDRMMVVSIQTEPAFKAGAPRLLFEGSYNYNRNEDTSDYDITPNGQRFVMIKSSEQEQPPRQIHVVLNWFEELKRLVPVD